MAKEFAFRGASLDQLREMSVEDFARLCSSRERRALKRGFTDVEKKLLLRVKKNPKGFHRTRAREMVIVPDLLGVKLGVHNGKEYVPLEIRPEHLGRRIGDFVMTRKLVKHSAPGFGATRSSKYVPLK
jgi:small subunit ribosomal protein S19